MTELYGKRLIGQTGMRYAATRALIVAGAGVVLSQLFPVAWWIILIVIILAMASARFAHGYPLYVALAAAALLYARARTLPVPEPGLYQQNRSRGVVVEEPLTRINPRLVVKLAQPWWGKVSVWLRDSSNTPRYGDLVELRNEVRPFSFPRNPGLVDYNIVLSRRGFVGQTNVRKSQITVLSHGHGKIWMRLLIVPCRRYVFRTINRFLPRKEGALLTGLLLGNKQGLPRSVQAAFADSGVMHVLAVSGLHVGIVIGMIWLLLSLIWVRGWWRFGLIAFAVIMYVGLTGARPASFRAMVMGLAALLSIPTQRRVTPVASLSVAGLFLLAMNPQALFEAGFQLSFVATLAILLIVPPISRKLHSVHVSQWLRKNALLALAVSGTAFLGIAPLLLHYFYRVAMLSPFSSLLIVPLVGLAIPLGFLVVVVNLVSGFVAAIFAESLRLVLSVILWLTQFLGGMDWTVLEPGKLCWPWICCIYGLFFLALNWRRGWARTGLRLGLAVSLNILVWRAAFTRPQTNVVFLDPGRGDAVFLGDSLGRTVLIDAGINRKRVLRDFLRSRGIHRIDIAVVTHPDIDHYGGLLDLDNRFHIDKLLISTTQGRHAYQRMLDRFRKDRTEFVIAGKGTEIQGLGFGLRFIWPEGKTRFLYRKGLVSTNNMSLVAFAEYAGFEMLFTGDLDDPNLIQDQDVRADLLKSPHHGSRKGNRQLLYDCVQPRYVVVMGRYPTPAGLEQRLIGYGNHYINTRQEGAWILRFRNNEPVACPYLASRFGR